MEFLGLKVKLGHGVFERLDFKHIWDNDSN